MNAFFEQEKPDQVYLAAAKVGGIYANDTYPAEFIYQNLMIEANVIDAAFRHGVQKLPLVGLKLHLSQSGGATHARRCNAHRRT